MTCRVPAKEGWRDRQVNEEEGIETWRMPQRVAVATKRDGSAGRPGSCPEAEELFDMNGHPGTTGNLALGATRPNETVVPAKRAGNY